MSGNPAIESHPYGPKMKESLSYPLSADKFRKNGDLERKALRQSKLIVFCLSKQWSDQPYWEKSAHLLRWWPHIVEQAQRFQGGAAFRVPWRLNAGKPKFEQIPF